MRRTLRDPVFLAIVTPGLARGRRTSVVLTTAPYPAHRRRMHRSALGTNSCSEAKALGMPGMSLERTTGLEPATSTLATSVRTSPSSAETLWVPETRSRRRRRFSPKLARQSPRGDWAAREVRSGRSRSSSLRSTSSGRPDVSLEARTPARTDVPIDCNSTTSAVPTLPVAPVTATRSIRGVGAGNSIASA